MSSQNSLSQVLFFCHFAWKSPLARLKDFEAKKGSTSCDQWCFDCWWKEPASQVILNSKL